MRQVARIVAATMNNYLLSNQLLVPHGSRAHPQPRARAHARARVPVLTGRGRGRRFGAVLRLQRAVLLLQRAVLLLQRGVPCCNVQCSFLLQRGARSPAGPHLAVATCVSADEGNRPKRCNATQNVAT